jgi:hypothetical protein
MAVRRVGGHDYGIFDCQEMRRRKATTFLPGSHINMRDEIADRPPLTTHLLFALGACLALAFLTCCTSSVGNSVTFFSDPGKYQFSSCEQLAKQRKDWSEKEQDLRLLMERAEQGTGGVVVNVIAYKADYVAATEELKVLENAARSPSNSAVR